MPSIKEIREQFAVPQEMEPGRFPEPRKPKGPVVVEISHYKAGNDFEGYNEQTKAVIREGSLKAEVVLEGIVKNVNARAIMHAIQMGKIPDGVLSIRTSTVAYDDKW